MNSVHYLHYPACYVAHSCSLFSKAFVAQHNAIRTYALSWLMQNTKLKRYSEITVCSQLIHNMRFRIISKQCTLASRISSGLVRVVRGEGLIILPVFKNEHLSLIIIYHVFPVFYLVALLPCAFMGYFIKSVMYVKTITSISPHINLSV